MRSDVLTELAGCYIDLIEELLLEEMDLAKIALSRVLSNAVEMLCQSAAMRITSHSLVDEKVDPGLGNFAKTMNWV